MLDSLGMGIKELSDSIWASRKAGAWKSKITGAGGHIIAITNNHNLIGTTSARGQAIATRATDIGTKNINKKELDKPD